MLTGSVAGTSQHSVLSLHSQPCSKLVAPVPPLWGKPLVLQWYPLPPWLKICLPPSSPRCPNSVLQSLSNPCYSPFFPHRTTPSNLFLYPSLLRPSQHPHPAVPASPSPAPGLQHVSAGKIPWPLSKQHPDAHWEQRLGHSHYVPYLEPPLGRVRDAIPQSQARNHSGRVPLHVITFVT